LALRARADAHDLAQFAFALRVELRRIRELLLGCFAFFDFFGETDFVVFGEENVLADVGEIEPYEIFFVSIDAILGH